MANEANRQDDDLDDEDLFGAWEKRTHPKRQTTIQAFFDGLATARHQALRSAHASGAREAEEKLGRAMAVPVPHPAYHIIDEMLERDWRLSDLYRAIGNDPTSHLAAQMYLMIRDAEPGLRLGTLAADFDRAFGVSSGFFAGLERQFIAQDSRIDRDASRVGGKETK